MSEKGLTNISVKKITDQKFINTSTEKNTSKLQIVQDLQMGLSTVSQNLNLLEQDGLNRKKMDISNPPAEEKQMRFRLYLTSEFPLALVF